MANPLLDAIGTVGTWADAPGAYLRGALAGRPGERRSGREMLQDWGAVGENTPGLDWGDVAGFGTEMVADPLALAGPAIGAFKGIQGLTRGAQALSHTDDVNPLLRAVAGFAGDESGVLKAFRPVRLPGKGNPYDNFKRLASEVGVDFAPFSTNRGFRYQPVMKNSVAVYAPYDKLVIPNTVDFASEWLTNQGARDAYASHPDWLATRSALQTPVHEIGHALHARAIGDPGRFMDLAKQGTQGYTFNHPLMGRYEDIQDVIANTRWVSDYAGTNPAELVAEMFAKQALAPEEWAGLPGHLHDYYLNLHGPLVPGKLADKIKYIKDHGLDLSLIGPLLGAGALGGAAGAAYGGRGDGQPAA